MDKKNIVRLTEENGTYCSRTTHQGRLAIEMEELLRTRYAAANKVILRTQH